MVNKPVLNDFEAVIAGNARKETEQELWHSIVTKENFLGLNEKKVFKTRRSLKA